MHFTYPTEKKEDLRARHTNPCGRVSKERGQRCTHAQVERGLACTVALPAGQGNVGLVQKALKRFHKLELVGTWLPVS